MNIIVNVSIAKPIADVWEVMGNQFGQAAVWSSNFKTSAPGGEAKFEGLDYSRRDTTTDRGNTIQELTAFDPANYSLSYVITAGAPPIAQVAGATWSLNAASDSSTEVHLDFVMEPKMELSPEMEAKIRMGLTQSVQVLGEELKYYLETGTPHPNNQ